MKKIFSKILGTVLLCLIIVMVISEGHVVFAAKFSLGDVVEVINTGALGLWVRDAPAGKNVTKKYDGDRGMIIGGPESAYYGGVLYTWWQIRWGDDVGLEGWSAEGYPGGVDYLKYISIPTSNKFDVGDFVKVYGTGGTGLKVRSDPPELARIGAVYDETIGKVIGGPFYGVGKYDPAYYYEPGFYYFWKIDYGSIVGWSAENWTTEVPPPPNQPPYAPTAGSQYRSDGVTVISEGGTTPESAVVFKATVGDPDGDSVRLEIELRQIGEAFTGEPTPETISDFVPSGTEVTITRYGLVNADYHWRYRANDSNGATSSWTEFGTAGNIDFTVSIPDTTPPAAVTDLKVSLVTANYVILTWTAPGDDGNIGTASEYDIRYSASPITQANWDSAIQASGEPEPSVAGDLDSFGVTGLSPETTYYFALKTADEVPNWSPLSNVVEAVTTPNQPPVASFTYSPTKPKSGEQVTFDASASYDPDPEGKIDSYEWDFGDGTKAVGMKAPHRFRGAQNEPKTYTVTLTVEDNDGATDTETTSVTVEPLTKLVDVGSGYFGVSCWMKTTYNWVGTDEATGENLYIISKIETYSGGVSGTYQLFILRRTSPPPSIPKLVWYIPLPTAPILRTYVTPFTPSVWQQLWGEPAKITTLTFQEGTFQGIGVTDTSPMLIVATGTETGILLLKFGKFLGFHPFLE